jgi:transposase
MRGPYPGDLRIRVIEYVAAGGSRREAAEQFEVSASSAIRWVQRFREDGTSEPMPRRGSTSPLEKYSQQILVLIRDQPDLTLNELVSALRKRRIPGEPKRAVALLRSPWHHFQKKAYGLRSGSGPTWLARVDAGSANKAGLIQPGSSFSMRQHSPPTWCGLTGGAPAATAWSRTHPWDTGTR